VTSTSLSTNKIRSCAAALNPAFLAAPDYVEARVRRGVVDEQDLAAMGSQIVDRGEASLKVTLAIVVDDTHRERREECLGHARTALNSVSKV
jgi:hypothetical protein